MMITGSWGKPGRGPGRGASSPSPRTAGGGSGRGAPFKPALWTVDCSPAAAHLRRRRSLPPTDLVAAGASARCLRSAPVPGRSNSRPPPEVPGPNARPQGGGGFPPPPAPPTSTSDCALPALHSELRTVNSPRPSVLCVASCSCNPTKSNQIEPNPTSRRKNFPRMSSTRPPARTFQEFPHRQRRRGVASPPLPARAQQRPVTPSNAH